MLERARGLRPAALSAIAELEERTIAVDGGRLKLERDVLAARDDTAVHDLLWWEGGRLLGFLGRYAFGGPAVELAGMVDPAARRRGIGTALLDAALPLCLERGAGQVLLVVPRGSAGGRALAHSRGAELEHSEHALVLTEPPADAPRDPRVTIRPGQRGDAAAGALVIELAGTVVGMLRVSVDGDRAGIHGFAIEPAWQGRGIGRDVLRRVCSGLFAAGLDRIGLEVAVDNDRALGLYTSIGFTRFATEDYYALPWPPRPGTARGGP